MDEAETAQALGWPRGTVKSRLNRALRKLEQKLGTARTVEGRTGEGREWVTGHE